MKKALVVTLVFVFILLGAYWGFTGQTMPLPQEIPPSSSVPQTPAEYNRNIDEASIQLIQFNENYPFTHTGIISTNYGEIKLGFYGDKAPKAVENFTELAKAGYYNGLLFHNVAEDYMIQGGEPQEGGSTSIWGTPFQTELSLDLWNFRGAVGMASAELDQNNSQFYIIQAPQVTDSVVQDMVNANFPQKVIDLYKTQGGAPWLDGKHTIFAQVIEGMETVNAISRVITDGNNRPVQPVIISQVTIEVLTPPQLEAKE